MVGTPSCGRLWRSMGPPENCGHPCISTEGMCNHLTTRSRHRSSVLGSRPTAQSRQSTSRITPSVGLWPGTKEVTVTSSSPQEDLVTVLTCREQQEPPGERVPTAFALLQATAAVLQDQGCRQSHDLASGAQNASFPPALPLQEGWDKPQGCSACPYLRVLPDIHPSVLQLLGAV